MTTGRRKPAAGKPAARKPAARKPAARKPGSKRATTSAAAPPNFPVVGIGASAGGLAAIEEFLAAMPTDGSLGMAFVIVQHLDPDHESLLLDLVKRYTSIDVAWAEDGMEVRSGCAYVMPPNKDMALMGGRLCLVKPEAPRGRRLPIDFFFRSLAADLHERAVCIVLSGTGSDGTLGLRAIKGEGGMAIAQTPETAGYDGMPRSAIATGQVDFILPPTDMPGQLLSYVSHACLRTPSARAKASEGPDQLPQVLLALRDRTGHDFSHYKTSTLRRRVERRMVVTRVERIDDYVALLKRDSLEVETLFRELLIGVTNFFRDTPAFETLAAEALPRLIAARVPGDPVRVWVPGCSTGEEAYSIAILLQELAGSVKRNVSPQVFATDIDAEAVERARAGVYPDSISADVSPERLERFFVRDGDTYRVAKTVRDCLVFAKQDVIKDPPFTRVDLISCRNLLIYLDGELQRKLMPLFHYALNSDGYLFLGSSETVGEAADLFAPVDKKWKLYQRRGTVTPRQLLTTAMPPRGGSGGDDRRPELRAVPLRLRVRDLAERTLLDKHAPACVVINAEGDVLYIHGHTGRYLEPPAGEPSGSLLKMARQGLRLELAAGIRKALTQKEALRYERLRVKTDGGTSLVNLIIEPMSGPDAVKGVLLVLFEDAPAENAARNATATEPIADREQRIADLDRELAAKEEYLRSTVEELETSNEELKSTSEEMQSTNEELQSTNEEMETSREELQSVNEELVTVNSELQQKIVELSRANNDMNNMLAGTGIGTLFVDTQLLISRFTSAITVILGLIPTDIGRPLSDIAPHLKGDADVLGAVSTVLDTLAPVEAQVESSDGRIFQMRIQPYRTLDNVIEGAVLTFVDISARTKLEAERDALARTVAEAGRFAQSILDTVREPKLVLDEQLTIVNANRSFLTTFEHSLDAVVGRPLAEIDSGAWLTPDLTTQLLAVLPKMKSLDDFRLSVATSALGPCTVTLNAIELLQTHDKRRLMLLTITDVAPSA